MRSILAILTCLCASLSAAACAPVLNGDLLRQANSVADDPARPELALLELRLAEHFAKLGDAAPTTCAGLGQYDAQRPLAGELETRLILRFPQLAPFDRCERKGKAFFDSITGEPAIMFDAHEVECQRPDLCTGWAGFLSHERSSGWRFFEARYRDGYWQVKRKELDIVLTGAGQ